MEGGAGWTGCTSTPVPGAAGMQASQGRSCMLSSCPCPTNLLPSPTCCPGRAACASAGPAHQPTQAPAPAAQRPAAATGGGRPGPPLTRHAALWGWRLRRAARQLCRGCARGSTTPARRKCSGRTLRDVAQARVDTGATQGMCRTHSLAPLQLSRAEDNPAAAPCTDRHATRG